jgi:hypothetical protein
MGTRRTAASAAWSAGEDRRGVPEDRLQLARPARGELEPAPIRDVADRHHEDAERRVLEP